MDSEIVYKLALKETFFSYLPPEILAKVNDFYEGDVIMKLAKLLPVNDPTFLFKITNHIVLAGNSVVYSLCGDFDTSLVSIELYALKNSDVREVAKMINQWVETRKIEHKWLTHKTAPTWSWSNSNHSLSKLRVILEGKRKIIKISLMKTSYKTAKEVIKRQPVDYLQCGYYKGRLIQTKACKKAISERKISKINHTWTGTSKRSLNALKRGFYIDPVFDTQVINKCYKRIYFPCSFEKRILYKLDEWKRPLKSCLEPKSSKIFDPNVYYGIRVSVKKNTFPYFDVQENDPWYKFFTRIKLVFHTRIQPGSCFLIVKLKPHKEKIRCECFNIEDLKIREHLGLLPKDFGW